MKKVFILFTIIFSVFFIKVYAKGYGVGPIKNNQRPNTYVKEIIENNGYTIGQDEKVCYLTFDCGYENGYTIKILDQLKENDVKACFFVTGHYIKSSADIVKRMIDDGHIVGNHSMNHKSFPSISDEEILKEIKDLEALYYEKFNIEISNYIRPPKGEYDQRVMKLLSKNNYKTIFWSLAYIDWYKDKYYGNDYSYNKVMSKMHNGAIILMHTVSKDNSTDLDKIIKKLKNDGYLFNTLDELC